MRSIPVNTASKQRLVGFITAYAADAILLDGSRRVRITSCDRGFLFSLDIEVLKNIVKMICSDINDTRSFDQIGAISMLLRKKGLCVTEGDLLTEPSSYNRAWNAFNQAITFAGILPLIQ